MKLRFLWPFPLESDMAVISVCSPIIKADVETFNMTGLPRQLAGVVCIDLSIDDLLQDFIYFKMGQHSYSFIIDQ